MSLITRCPACATMFKVVPDQLRVSEGWVRCGQCEEVFDANAHMQSAGYGAAAPSTTTDHVTAPSTANISRGKDADAQGDALAPFASEAVENTVLSDLGSALEWPPESKPIDDVYIEPSEHDRLMSAASHSPEVASLAEDIAVVMPAKEVAAASAPTMASMKTPSFMRTAKKRSRQAQRPVFRWSLRLLAFGLALGLGLQWMHLERDQIAASVPQARPWMVQWCEVAGCQLAPVRHIEAVLIDSSSFAPVRGDVYRLNLTLRNKSAIDIAAPALELTLTDLADQPMVRKVLTESELGAPNHVLLAGAEFSASIPVRVKQPSGGESVRGYRVLAFYP